MRARSGQDRERVTAAAGTEIPYAQLAALVAERMGLHFPPERWEDLRRGLASAAVELGLDDAAECAGWLLRTRLTREQVRVLAGHLTIGETYFFRELPTMKALAERVLPELIEARRGREQRLRIWSAACSTGEEPYSVAILLRELLPDLRDWSITLHATDINPRVLQKARAGLYGEWSFRNGLDRRRERSFRRTPEGRYALDPEIRRMVTFGQLNLAEGVDPSLEHGTNAMDLILCRNVLMYFTPSQVRRVVAKLTRSLVDGGWLIVSPSEATSAWFPRLRSVNFPGAIFFRKCESAASNADLPAPGLAPAPEPAPPLPPVERVPARTLYGQGRYEECVEALERETAGTPDYALLARALANLGRLSEALAWCDRWTEAERMSASAHYLRAIILLERGAVDEARRSLRRTIYLEPRFVLAHFTLGNIARALERHEEAARHFANALDLLRDHDAGELLPESDGLTAGCLAETIRSMTSMEILK